MSAFPAMKKQLGDEKHTQKEGIAHVSAFWHVQNVREIVLDYSHLSHENYGFFLEFASDQLISNLF